MSVVRAERPACRYIDETVVEAVVMDVARVSAARWQVCTRRTRDQPIYRLVIEL